jgi:hypothetical protein
MPRALPSRFAAGCLPAWCASGVRRTPAHWRTTGGMLFIMGLGCGEATGPEAAMPTAGTYVLKSVDGCAPGPAAAECFPRPSWVLDGEMVLRADGSVTRTMHYQLPSDPAAGPVMVSGTYSRRGDVVHFALVEDVHGARYVWRPRARLSEHGLTVRYPHPADGETVEVFARR